MTNVGQASINERITTQNISIGTQNAFKLHFTLLNYFPLFHRFKLLGMYSKVFKHAECHGLAKVKSSRYKF